MTKQELQSSIEADLGANYQSSDSELLGAILDEVIQDALLASGRNFLPDQEAQLGILSSNIRKAVKSIYLLRGAEDVKSQSVSGLSSTFENAVEQMTYDIIRTGKRVLR